MRMIMPTVVIAKPIYFYLPAGLFYIYVVLTVLHARLQVCTNALQQVDLTIIDNNKEII